MGDVPNRFHFVFGLKPQTEPFHIAYYLCLESCRRVNRPQVMHFYYYYEPFGPWWDKIRTHLQLHRVEPLGFITNNQAYWQHKEGTYIKLAGLDYAHQSDFIRLEVLCDHGGIYADIDTLFVNPLPESLFAHQFVIGSEGMRQVSAATPPYVSLCNAFMMAQPDARFARQWLTDMYQLFDGTWDRHSCYAASMLGQRMPDAVHVAPQRYFYRYNCTTEDLKLLLEDLDDDLQDVYSIHLWGHLWWDPGRKDFSGLHSGTLTEEYIHTVDTTYNVIARTFLD